MKLSIRISLVIGAISVLISTVVAGASYYIQLTQATFRNETLVMQLAQSATKTSAIAAYLNDYELANEIVSGLVANDLIARATILIVNNKVEIVAGDLQADSSSQVKPVEVLLINPFVEDDTIGQLIVYPRVKFIKQQASSVSLQNAGFLLILSIIIAIIVGLYVRLKLTRPLVYLSTELSKIDTSKPNTMNTIAFKSLTKDEISMLVLKTNSLINALKLQFRSEINLRKKTEELEKRFRLIFEQSTAGICLIDQTGLVTMANPAFNALLGNNTENTQFANYFVSPKIINDEVRNFNSIHDHQIELALVKDNNGVSQHFHCFLSRINDARQEPRKEFNALIEVIIYDVTAHKEEARQARYEADHDSLTELLNRRSGQIWLEETLSKLSSDDSVFAIMMIDLDKFKPINDEYGHDAGDIVLAAISRRLTASIGEFDAKAIRWGGDEFLIGLRMSDKNEVENMASLILGAIANPISIPGDKLVQVGASVGVLVVCADRKEHHSIETLINKADELMYEVKHLDNKASKGIKIVSV